MELTETGTVDLPTPASGTPPAAAPSADPVPDTAPVDPAPADTAPAATPKEETLYDLPDGRKVTADVLQKEWKDNFLPDYTKKAQRIAEIDRAKAPTEIKSDEPEWKNPDYQPKSYAEVIEIAKQEALLEQGRIADARVAHNKAIEDKVNGDLAELKKTDPSLNESALFQHANKYGFSDLRAAHTNMSDMRKAVVETEQRTLKNVKTREADPVSTAASGANVSDDVYDPGFNGQFGSALEFLSRVKAK